MGRPIIQVDGAIGAGKTYYIQNVLLPALMSTGLRVLVINEPVDDWAELLPLLYQNPSRWAYTFETKAFVARIRTIMAALAQTDIDIFICERGLLSQAIFVNILQARNNLNEFEVASYQAWSAYWPELIREHPTHIIYVRTELDICMTRVARRNRHGEHNLSRDYVQDLIQAHDNQYLGISHFPITSSESAEVILIDFSADMREFQPYQNNILEHLGANMAVLSVKLPAITA